MASVSPLEMADVDGRDRRCGDSHSGTQYTMVSRTRQAARGQMKDEQRSALLATTLPNSLHKLRRANHQVTSIGVGSVLPDVRALAAAVGVSPSALAAKVVARLRLSAHNR